jgi:hypothetical protein
MTTIDGSEPKGLRDLLADHSDEVADLTRRLRAFIRTNAARTGREGIPRWHGLDFHHPATGYVATLFPREHDVNVGFEHGADLPDPHGLLQGNRRQVRYLIFTPRSVRPSPEDLIEYLDLALGE